MTSRRARQRENGFTLVELVAVVAIVSVLALLAVYGVGRYVAVSKVGEAIELIGSIKAAQESYKDETFSYLSVTADLDTYYPNNSEPGQRKVGWGGEPADVAGRFATLGVQPAGPVTFVYSCVAGGPTTALPTTDDVGFDIGAWPTGATGAPFYVVKAVADLRRGGARTTYVAPSFSNQIFSDNVGE